ncbi:MAG: hypothetical protein JO001_05425 [Alphaproteobacteria bacterium]|nr:hypothetical protein [Alphaproteobacteria bacterium]
MRKLCCLLLALISGGSAPSLVSAATLCDAHVGFSADRTLMLDGHTYTGKIWTMPGKERHEQTIHAFSPVFILRNDTPLGEIVLPQMKTIVQFTMPAELRVLDIPQLTKHPAGSETVNGIATTKYAIDETVPEGHAEGTLWLSRDGIPMKLDGSFTRNSGRAAKVHWELNHVKIGPQPASLFEAPQGFSKLPPEAIAPLLGLRLKPASHS